MLFLSATFRSCHSDFIVEETPVSCETLTDLLPKEKYVGNKAKEWISKHVIQENKIHQIFQKMNTRTCVYQGHEMFVFQKIWRAFFSCNTRFEIHTFVLLPTNMTIVFRKSSGRSPSRSPPLLEAMCFFVFSRNHDQINYCFLIVHYENKESNRKIKLDHNI